MSEPREIKSSKIAEVQLRQAAELLREPRAFRLPSLDASEYARDLRRESLEQAMVELERIARSIGCRSGFWRRLEKVAETLQLYDAAQKYE